MNKILLLALLLWCSVAAALTLEEPLSDAAQEARARAVFAELRCVVCQGESIADSNAQVAVDMRREIRAQVAAGKKTDDIIYYFSKRYGDYVRMRPPLNATTALLWLGPPVILFTLFLGLCIFFYFSSRKNK
jgi:cytochrome c-type biogenesis protein CcmH